MSQGRDILGLLGWLALVAAMAWLGAVGSADAPTFYAALDRPAWAPPAAWFGPVWTVLYALMAIAAWGVWRQGGFARQRVPLALFLLQLALNSAWSWLFFAWRLGSAAFADILLLALLLLATVVAFRRVKAWTGALLLPYLAWVCYAAALNYAVWRANPGLLG